MLQGLRMEKDMKILVTGVKGQLGHDVVLELEKRGHEVVPTDAEEMDITDSAMVEEVISFANPDGVIHCAAYTAVDKAEDDADTCRRVNALGTENIARVCKKLNCKMMYISTDYVFDGQGERPWEPDDEVTTPLNVYGQTKYEGEQAVRANVDRHYIVRIAWVFGVNGHNFVRTMLRLGRQNGAVKVVDDQIGSPTYTEDLSRLLVDMMETDRYGTYHATNEGLCSWYDFACEIFKCAGMDVSVTPVKSSEFASKAKRPFNSRMSKDKLEANGFQRLPDWRDATRRYVELIKDEI
jgi:dTDP-4-dehydrorhamnose reductase